MNATESCIHELISNRHKQQTCQDGLLSLLFGLDTPIWRQPSCPKEENHQLPPVSELVRLAKELLANEEPGLDYLEFWSEELPELIQEFCTTQEDTDQLMNTGDSIQLLAGLLHTLCSALDGEQEIAMALDGGYLSICRLIQYHCTDSGIWLQVLGMVGSIVASIHPAGTLVESVMTIADALVSQAIHLDLGYHVQSAVVALVYSYALWDSGTRTDPAIKLINHCASVEQRMHLKKEVGGLVLALLDLDILAISRDVRMAVARLSHDINPSVRLVWQPVSDKMNTSVCQSTEITPFAILLGSLREHTCLKNIADISELVESMSIADAKLVIRVILESQSTGDSFLDIRAKEIITAIYLALPIQSSRSATLYEVIGTVVAIACYKIYHLGNPQYGQVIEHLATVIKESKSGQDWATELGFHFRKREFLSDDHPQRSALLASLSEAPFSSNNLPAALFVCQQPQQGSNNLDQVIHDLQQLNVQQPIQEQPAVDLGQFDDLETCHDPMTLILPCHGDLVPYIEDDVFMTRFDKQQPMLDQAGTKRWWAKYVSNRITQSIYITSPSAMPSQSFIDSVLESVSTNDRMEIYFAQPSDLWTFNLDDSLHMGVPSLNHMDMIGIDKTKAHEALLYYYYCYCQFDCGQNRQQLNQLYGYLLTEGTGRVRFTGTGTFDPTSIFIADLASHPTNAPELIDTLSLTHRAIDQLSPYIPQLLAMLRSSQGVSSSICTVSESALVLLVEFARYAPHLVVFYLAVAYNSCDKTASTYRLLEYVLNQLEDQSQLEEVRVFLRLLNNLKVLPQERLRSQCLKAQTMISNGTDIQRSLKTCLQILQEKVAWPESPAVVDYLAMVPQLHLLFQQLPVCKNPEKIWSQIFKLLDTPPLNTLTCCAPKLLQLLLTRIPIPQLTTPTDPVTLEGLQDSIRVIGSKTRPKLLTLRLSGSQGMDNAHYILKGSEDLRADESVIQVFQRLNLLVQDNSVSVYNVVPIDRYGGLIEVVGGMTSLFHYYILSKGDNIQKTYSQAKERRGSKSRLDIYQHLLESSHTEDLLYRQLLRSAISSQHLLLSVQNMVRSIAISSTMGYLLGVGDRHLNNLLVDSRRGGIMQIDFNISFDIGTISTVPEIVPFRMTPILRYLCTQEMFIRTAQSVMLLMRMDKQTVVRAILSRLGYQPLGEWQRTSEVWSKDTMDHQTTLEVIRKSGVCPVGGFVPDQPTAERIADCAVGRVQARLEFQCKGLSEAEMAKEQARVVWEAATDKGHLSKMFVGWASWI